MAVGKNDRFVFIAPYIQDTVMDKEFKELCRKAKIPKNIRCYIYKEKIDIASFTKVDE
jgi:tRNA(Ile)-lysidine synthase